MNWAVATTKISHKSPNYPWSFAEERAQYHREGKWRRTNGLVTSQMFLLVYLTTSSCHLIALGFSPLLPEPLLPSLWILTELESLGNFGNVFTYFFQLPCKILIMIAYGCSSCFKHTTGHFLRMLNNYFQNAFWFSLKKHYFSDMPFCGHFRRVRGLLNRF